LVLDVHDLTSSRVGLLKTTGHLLYKTSLTLRVATNLTLKP